MKDNHTRRGPRMRSLLHVPWWTIALLAISACAGGNFAGTAPQQDAGPTEADGSLEADATSEADSGATAEDAGAAACGEQTGARPARRSEHMGEYDPVSGNLAMFGGSFAIPENCGFPASTFETEMWIYNVQCDRWRELKGTTPPARARGMSAYRDSGSNQSLIVVGGRYRPGKSGSYTLYDDLWAFDYKSEKWSELAQTKVRPAARANASMVYTKKLDALLLFGGNTSKSGLQIAHRDDTWLYDFATSKWTELAPQTRPAKRLWSGHLWDEKRGQMVIFGGGDSSAFANTAKYMNDVWALKVSADGAQWTRLDAKSAQRPDTRFWASMAYDKQNDRYLMFGGHDDKALGNRNDLWAFTPDDGQWLIIHVADTPNKPANGQCSFPPDFTKMDDFSPERRYAGVFSAGPSAVWVHGGKTDCGVIDDLFKLDLKTYKWHEVTPSTVGNGCIRKGGLSCNDYCF